MKLYSQYLQAQREASNLDICYKCLVEIALPMIPDLVQCLTAGVLAVPQPFLSNSDGVVETHIFLNEPTKAVEVN